MSDRPVAELLLGRPPMDRDLPSFDPDRAPAGAGQLFVDWLTAAVAEGVDDPQVVTLSTVDADGAPDARMLVLRDVDVPAGAWVFAGDADSPKGRQLAVRAEAAMTLYWPPMGRQIRIRGRVEQAGPEEAAAEFLSRSPASRVAELVGRQSEPLGSLAAYDEAVREAQALTEVAPELVAPGHTVYRLLAREVEFWQGSADRRHIRLLYVRTGPVDAPAVWARTLLWP
ncbi:pyridoxal 5'-phosphate synthase [Streptacidiphilus sp. PB12-B1b]|uniref:pyridoxine/pyridoxamine 5'-phosphate oxidase n=1 Tax=Streptacidiphilus sp. PB12-B1b TaxID=2705012 RepID=UPI0015F9F656|nr:pyridoxal 5'-phosphate synthase [Streptacidiphilus sp. PB12-B1b]QMU76123.1 pyridoxal 5'-phosphate synthase [Streptacidiphilus sp. PB12-B1b]